jgi:molybdenum cofactor cytidylyltransferase
VTSNVSIVILAAGASSRMGHDGFHKLLAEFGGVPLVRRMAMTALQSKAVSVSLVTGFRREEIEDCVSDLSLNIIFNSDFRSGIASSIIAGVSQLDQSDGILIMLADMPRVTSSDLDALITGFEIARGKCMVRATSADQPGNPVILPSVMRNDLLALRGDMGAKRIISGAAIPIVGVDIGDSALLDVDTPQALYAAGGVLVR